MSFRTMEDQQRAIRVAALEAEKKKVIGQVYGKYQQMIHCEANERQIIGVIERFAGVDVVPTFDLFETALAENPKEMKNFATQPVERTREQIIEEILTLLASKNGGRDGKFNDFNLRSEEKRMASWTPDALRNRLHEIRTRQRMASTPVPVLKSFVRDAHRDPNNKFPGWPVLPARMVPPGKIQAVDVNADYLNGLVRTDIWQFKRLVRLYGSEQVDARRGLK